MEQNFVEALRLQKQVLSLCDRLDHQHPNYGLYLLNGGRYAYLVKDYTLAVAWWEKALPLVDKFGSEYEFLLNYLADSYMTLNDKKNLKRIMTLTTEHNEYQLTLPCDEPICMAERAEYYSQRGDHAQAKDWYTKAMAMDLTDEQKAMVYAAYVRFLEMQRDFSAAADYSLLTAKAVYATKGTCSEYATTLYQTAIYDFLSRKYDAAIDLYQQALDYYKGVDDPKADELIAQCNHGIGNALWAAQQSQASIPYFQKEVEFYHTQMPDSPKYPDAIVSLAQAERWAEAYDAAIEHYQEAMALYEKLESADKYEETQHALLRCCAAAHKPLPTMLESDAAARMRIAKIDRIIQEETDNLKITSMYAGEYAKASSLGVIAGCYAYKEDYDQSVNYFEQYLPTLRNALREQFRIQNEEERMYAWGQESTNISELFELTVALENTHPKLLTRYAPTVYDAALLSKGILLNSSIEFEKLLSTTYKDRPELKALYDQTRSTDNELNALRATANTDADMERILALSRENGQRQLELSRCCAEIADYTQYMGYTWRDVQKSLTKKDIAIEFVQVGDKVLDDYQIYAVVLNSELKLPVIISLDSIQQILDESDPNVLYTSDSIGQRVWGPLSTYIDSKTNIYFSPAGEFNNIAIEYMSYRGAPLSEQKHVYRLSSTKTLCYQSVQTNTDNAVLIGNIDYGQSAGLTASTEQRIKTLGAKRNGDAFIPLTYTLHEVQQIEQTLKSSHVNNIQLFQGAEASEPAFKALSGRDIEVLHIATHGALLETPEELDDEQSEDYAMQNSILAFAGINQNQVDANSDGVVSAADISQMDFRKCHLAVLSACETGLGHLGADGVFGLQRGFKNAGVGAILMSLWQVSDAATSEMMVQFYKALYSGANVTPNDALRTAQKYLRTHGYNDPELWAAFIVLDGQRTL
jgi:CHAT domain-containing protein/tetratricopeptide (TPR) repeat protein